MAETPDSGEETGAQAPENVEQPEFDVAASEPTDNGVGAARPSGGHVLKPPIVERVERSTDIRLTKVLLGLAVYYPLRLLLMFIVTVVNTSLYEADHPDLRALKAENPEEYAERIKEHRPTRRLRMLLAPLLAVAAGFVAGLGTKSWWLQALSVCGVVLVVDLVTVGMQFANLATPAPDSIDLLIFLSVYAMVFLGAFVGRRLFPPPKMVASD